MTNQYILSDNWHIHEDRDGLGIDFIKKQISNYIPAAVPGNIQGDLEAAHILPPLYYGAINPALYAVGTSDWWYKRELEITSEMTGKRITIDFEGVDYGCDVYIGDILIGHHNGMFERFFYDITGYVKTGTNILFVKIDRMPDELLHFVAGSDGKESGVGTDDFFVWGNNTIRTTLKGLKSPANLSYDWGTNIYTLGIWKPVTLHVTDEVRIDWLQIKSGLKDDFSGGRNTAAASMEIILDVNALTVCNKKIKYSIKGNGTDIQDVIDTKINEGESRISYIININNPKLWFPSGYGDQPLYDVTAEITGSDSISDTTAFRHIKFIDCEGAPENFEFKYQLVLNGIPIRTMGSNLAAMDLLFGRIGEHGVHYIEMAKNCNMNMLRLHGGQIVYPKSVYDAADRLGIMLSSEFPIGNCCIENDPELMDNLDVTYKNIIRQLRNHPSIIEWTGGNEMEWFYRPERDRTAMYREEASVHEADDTRLYRHTCSVPGSRHQPWIYQHHWFYKAYNAEMGDNFFITNNMRFGEFGVQTPANVDVWYRDIPPESRWPINEEDSVLIRKNAVNAVFSSMMWFGLDTIEELFGKLPNLETAVRAGQFLGGEGIRYALSALRAKDKKIGGFTTWDYNEPWPNGAGSFMVDYDGRPLMTYYFAKQAFERTSIQLRYENVLFDFFGDSFADVQIVCDDIFSERFGRMKWHYKCYNRLGEVYAEESGYVIPKYMNTQNVARFNITPPTKFRHGPVYTEVFLYDKEGTLVSEKVYIFGSSAADKPFCGVIGPYSKFPHIYDGRYSLSGTTGGNIERTDLSANICSYDVNGDIQEMKVCIKNNGKIAALFTDIKPLLEYRPRDYIDRNFICIPAGEKRIVTIQSRLADGYTLNLNEAGFIIDCFNAPTVKIEPSQDILFYIGRHDFTTHEYMQTVASGEQNITAENRTAAEDKLSYLLEGRLNINFSAGAGKSSKLMLHLADYDKSGLTRLHVRLGSYEKKIYLKSGLGIQKEKPYHLAFPESIILDIPAGVIKGSNLLSLETTYGWVTLDAIEIAER